MPGAVRRSGLLNALRGLGRFFPRAGADARLFKIVETAKRQWERTFDAMPELILVIDAEGQLQRVNRSLARRLGVEPRDLAQRPVGEALAGCHAAFTACELEPPGKAVEIVCTRLGGTFEVTSLPLADETGQPAGILRIGRDVTEHKQLLHQVVHADKMAAIGLMAAGIAHEVNNPAAYMMTNLGQMCISLDQIESAIKRAEGASEALREMSAAENLAAVFAEFREMVQETYEGGIRIRDIVRSLTAFSRKDTEAEPTLVAVGDVIEEVLRMTQHELRLRSQVVRDFAEVPPVLGHGRKLAQVVLNLVVNAVQAMEKIQDRDHALTLSTRLSPSGNVTLAVKDTGPGIPPEHINRIFDPFFTTKDIGKGTGLGLSVVAQIVKSHGGTIRVASQIGVGTTFTIELPAAEGEASRPHHLTPRAVAVMDSGPHGRILVIDDESILLRSYQRLLRRYGHVVVTAGSGREGLEILGKDTVFDAILCDIMMPDLRGSDLYAIVHQRWPTLAEKFVFLTGGAAFPEVAAFLAETNRPVVEKPVTDDVLAAAIRAAVERAQGGAE